MVLKGHDGALRLDPGTLHAEMVFAGEDSVLISRGLEETDDVSDLEATDSVARWRLRKSELSIDASVENDTLRFRCHASKPGKIVWPRFVPDSRCRALILPRYEGAYVPFDDAEWREHLAGSDETALAEDLSMPFWGIDLGARTLTFIVGTPFNTQLRYVASGETIGLELAHSFTRLDASKEYVVFVRISRGGPVEPARQYRRWLIEQGQLVTLSEKIRQTPRAERLLGAIHGYLWGSGYLCHKDVQDWPKLCRRLSQQASEEAMSPAKRLWSLLGKDAQQAAQEMAGSGGGLHQQQLLARELSAILESPKLYQREAWESVQLRQELRQKLEAVSDQTPIDLLCALNAELLCAAFPEHFRDPADWGDGISTKLLRDLNAAGIDRACLTLHDLTPGNKRPEVARLADQLGYLYGPYDSYHSIHPPGEKETWETAQFDRELCDKGAIVCSDGRKLTGFQKKGYKLSSLAARPYVERRVSDLMRRTPFSSWFIDCDATGECFDNYSELFPATQAQDFAARLDRLRWISRTYNLAVGSETGSGLAAGAIHFAHGMMTPVIGWGDPDLKDRKSLYWLGAYYPPESPTVFFKQVPLKPSYKRFHFDPRFRLPLYQAVFHDSVVTTHHWSSGSLKFTDQQAVTALLEQLYNVPPLYHFNLEEWARERTRILEHYRFFSPLHRELGLQPLTDFEWLTPDRLVQKTIFGDGTEIIANFGRVAVRVGVLDIEPETALSRRPNGATNRFSPSASLKR